MNNQDWPVLLSFFPKNWKKIAFETDLVKGLRKDKDLENYVRTLLIHLGCGHSLKETVARAKIANLASISNVALSGRLKKAKDWLLCMCTELFKEQGIVVNDEKMFNIRLFDATNVKEPGKTGSLWRIHYSLSLPSLACDFFKLTATKGRGTGESFFQYPIRKGDYIIADRAYSTPSGVCHVASKQAYMLVRVNTRNLILKQLDNSPFPLLSELQTLTETNMVGTWHTMVSSRSSKSVIGRLCAIRKSGEAIKLAHKKMKKDSQRHNTEIQEETLEYAKYIIVFTNFPEATFSAEEILNWYRTRWQIELTFKRFKSIAQLGHIPKRTDESAKAWLYGKLFVALLIEKLIRYASFFSPWGYKLENK